MTDGAGAPRRPGRRLPVIVGPTGSGKTALAVALAKRLGGVVISADSVQVYRYFDIGSGKPDQDERARAEHRLIDIVDPDAPMDAARWVDLADAEIAAAEASDRCPIICGGTFLWVRALLHGLAPAPPADEALRDEHRARAAVHGREALHEDLLKVDPPMAAKLAANDFVRVSRALEVHALTGKTLTDWQAEHGFRPQRYDYRLLGLGHDREALSQRMFDRIGRMLDDGWESEVSDLVARGYRDTRPMGAVGYRQVLAAVEATPRPPRSQLHGDIHRVTRIFARRQRTWLRDRDVTWLDPTSQDAAVARAVDSLG